MTSTPSPERVRLTISVTPEVHATFQRLASASSMSIGRAMGEWLGDTLEAVEFTASKVEQARAAPKIVMREMHAYALGLADETGAILGKLRAGKGAAGDALRAPPPTPARLVPPSSNTGGKGHQTKAGKTRGARS